MFRFRLFRVPFEVAGSFWLGCLLLSGLGTDISTTAGIIDLVVWVACVFLSIVVHELGHALAGRAFGLEPAVLLYAMGGVTYRFGAALPRAKSIVVSLAGPAFGFGLFAVALGLSAFASGNEHPWFDRSTLTGQGVMSGIGYLLFINLIWTLFNLLPILPLDGGQVFRDLMGPRLMRVTRIVGGLVAIAVCVWAAMSRQYFIALFLGYLAFLNFKGTTQGALGA
jgi:stage IV sporulation protein FB